MHSCTRIHAFCFLFLPEVVLLLKGFLVNCYLDGPSSSIYPISRSCKGPGRSDINFISALHKYREAYKTDEH